MSKSPIKKKAKFHEDMSFDHHYNTNDMALNMHSERVIRNRHLNHEFQSKTMAESNSINSIAKQSKEQSSSSSSKFLTNNTTKSKTNGSNFNKIRNSMMPKHSRNHAGAIDKKFSMIDGRKSVLQNSFQKLADIRKSLVHPTQSLANSRQSIR